MKKESEIVSKLKQDKKEDAGATMVEYCLMAALIALVCIAAVTFLGQRTSSKFSEVGSRLNN